MNPLLLDRVVVCNMGKTKGGSLLALQGAVGIGVTARGTVELSKVKLSIVLTFIVNCWNKCYFSFQSVWSMANGVFLCLPAGSPENHWSRPECDAATYRYLFDKSPVPNIWYWILLKLNSQIKQPYLSGIDLRRSMHFHLHCYNKCNGPLNLHSKFKVICYCFIISSNKTLLSKLNWKDFAI